MLYWTIGRWQNLRYDVEITWTHIDEVQSVYILLTLCLTLFFISLILEEIASGMYFQDYSPWQKSQYLSSAVSDIIH